MGWIDGVQKAFVDKEKMIQDHVPFRLSPKVQNEVDNALQNTTWTHFGCLGVAFVIGFKAGRVRPSWHRITSVSDISTSDIGPSSPLLKGRAISVSDGDTIRFLHTPTPFHSTVLKEGEKASETTLPIRVCTIDTPETKKFGKPGQPFGEDAKDHLTSMLNNKRVYIRLLQKDQYGRGVAEVQTGKWWPFKKNMDEQMLKAGLAEVYRGKGAVYGFRGKETYIEMEEKAKSQKKGIWSQKDRESAAEFKARLKAEG